MPVVPVTPASTQVEVVQTDRRALRPVEVLPPSLAAIRPAWGDVGGGIPVTISGTGLALTTGVTIGGTACTSVTVISDVEVQCVTPAKSAGVYALALTTHGGTDQILQAYESYYPSGVSGIRLYEDVGVTGSPVSSWADQGSGAQTLSQGSAGLRPAYASERFGLNEARHAVVFDNVDDVLALAAPVACQQRTVLVAIKWTSNQVPHFVPGSDTSEILTGTASAILDFALDATGGLTTMRTDDANAGINHRSPDDYSLSDGGMKVLGSLVDAAAGIARFYEGSSQVGADQVGLVPASNNWNKLGAAYGNSGACELACAVVLERVLTDAERLKIAVWAWGKFCARARSFRREAVDLPFFARDGAGLLAPKSVPYVFQVGGWNSQGGGPFAAANPKVTNEIWRAPTSNLKTGWRLIHANDATYPPVTCFPPQHTAGWLVHTHGGQEYLYALGSDIFNDTDDAAHPAADGHGNSSVWRAAVLSAGELGPWQRVTKTAAFGPIVLHMVASFMGAIIVGGGQTDVSNNATVSKKFWKSTDGGYTWVALPDFPGAGRGMVYDPCVLANKLWVIGGGGYAPPRTAGTSIYNGIYSLDSTLTTWTLELAEGAAPWQARIYHTTKAWQGRLWVMNGACDPSVGEADVLGNIGDCWSADPASIATWRRHTVVPWRNSHADGMCVLADRILNRGGNGEIGQGPKYPVQGDAKVYSLALLDFLPP